MNLTTFKKFSQNKMEESLRNFSDFYHNNNPIIDDSNYDLLYDYYLSIYPNSSFTSEVGAITNHR